METVSEAPGSPPRKTSKPTLWVKLPVDYYEDPRFDQVSAPAEVLYLRAFAKVKTLYTDGVITFAQLQRLGSRRPQTLCTELVDSGLFIHLTYNSDTSHLHLTYNSLTSHLHSDTNLTYISDTRFVVSGWSELNESATTSIARHEENVASGLRGSHVKYHERKGIIDPECPHCLPQSDSQPYSQPYTQSIAD
jgi:hypothetical protein